MLEKSLVILKPDAYLRRPIGASILLEFLNEKSLEFLAFKEVTPTRDLAEKHYAVHKDKPFFSKLIDYLTLSNVLVMVVQGEQVISKIREMLGDTFSHKASPTSIRGKYGIWDGINVVHASDAVETANNEITLWSNEGGVNIDEKNEVTEKIRGYINKWSHIKVNNTAKLREICAKASEDRGSLEEYRASMVELLKPECVDSDEDKINQFISVIFDSL